MSTTQRPGRLAVGIVGGGRVGSVLGGALQRAGHQIAAVSAVSAASRRLVRRHLPDVPVREVDDVVSAADLVLLAVPDDELPAVVEGLAETGRWRSGQLVAHVSGAHGIAVLEPVVRAGGLPLALHPVMTFTGRPEDADRIAGVSYGITAPEPLRPVAEALVVEMGGEPVWIPEQMRALYHAALAMGANHLITLVAESAALLRQAGVENPTLMLGPLLGAALDNALRSGDAALTGPVSRGDAGTVRGHLQTLRSHAPESVPAYVEMARLTADRALAAGRLDAAHAEALLDVLAARSDGARA
jgi:predicted short-subunit dehydrogenase-like oxidoreductase (DUF2520 family)